MLVDACRLEDPDAVHVLHGGTWLSRYLPASCAALLGVLVITVIGHWSPCRAVHVHAWVGALCLIWRPDQAVAGSKLCDLPLFSIFS